MQRLRRRSDFLAAAGGARAPAAAFVLQARTRGDGGPPRIGFTVSKKVGSAVERNRARRRLREVVRLSAAARLRPGNDYVVIARRAALELPFERLIKDFAGAVARLHRERPRAERASGARATNQAGGRSADDQSS